MDPTYRRLVLDIKDKSERGLIAWTPSSYADTYQANLGKGVITIMHDLDDHPDCPADYESPIAVLSFLNERGEIFNSIRCYTALDTDYPLLRDIYDATHSNYLKVDETLQSMFDDLNNR